MGKSGARKRDTYRHGDLRAAALQAAVEIVRREGAPALTLRRVAEETGVAHRSLYRHFRDKDALLAAVAALGYRRLAASVEKAATPKGFAAAYVRFALGEPHLYETMMTRKTADIAAEPALAGATQRLIVAALAILSSPGANGDARRRQVMRIWMGLHGGLSLHKAGLLRERTDRAFAGELLRIIELA